MRSFFTEVRETVVPQGGGYATMATRSAARAHSVWR